MPRGRCRPPPIPDTCQRTWGSTGWTNNKNVQQMLWFMLQRDEVAVVGKAGPARSFWDLAERVYGDAPLPDPDDAAAQLDDRRLRALGIARPTGPRDRAEPTYVRDAGEPAVIEGVRGKWRVEPSQSRASTRSRSRGGRRPPVDRLVMDRKRLDELFGFDYLLEMYKPGAAALGLLRAADPVRRPAGREARRHGRRGPRACSGSTRSTRTSVHDGDRGAVDAEIDDLARGSTSR